MSVQGFDAESFLRKLWALDDLLAERGFPRFSPWWRAELTRFFRALATGRRQWVVRVGRRGGKSTTWAKLAVAWALFGPWTIPAGDRGVVAFVSVSRDEAAQRLRSIGDMLRRLGEQFASRAEEIELGSRPCVFKVFSCSTTGVVGFTAIAVICDETARWENRESGANPAREVVGSLRPALATQPLGFLALSSSPWSQDDFHAQAFDAGETAAQITSYAPSWTANPTLSEAGTRSLEPDERTWRREFLAEPQSAVAGAFDPDAIVRAQREVPAGHVCAPPVVCVDMSDGRGDATAWAAVRWAWSKGEPRFLSRRACVSARLRDARGDLIEFDQPILDRSGAPVPNPNYSGPPAPVLIVGPIRSIVGKFWQSIRSADLVARIGADARAWGARFVLGDQRSDYALEPLFAGQGLRFASLAWSAPSKLQAVTRLRSWLRDGQIILPRPSDGDAAARLAQELAAFQERLSPSGTVVFGGRTGVHDDHVAVLVTAAMADAHAMVPASPTAPRPVPITWLPPA